ncbi:Swt1 family HEPN domain-containing protein [Sphingopyxis yananensis]|uniref:Swt1 family HEPN domain-containing protein n=1 Tax=Sphingopyxis yananensis TaxID=2886687 RepID=UPI001D11DB32|nr:Swt1 family HEPN domain-containing protein [Sphingopyxis yananensis]MCC2602327.1 hypothetical protein [Sphingopyxis yananensis]
MSSLDKIELFILKSSTVMPDIEKILNGDRVMNASNLSEAQLQPLVSQFPREVRDNAASMAELYKLFYMLENDIRKLICDTLSEQYGSKWWDKHVPEPIQAECRRNRQNEEEFGVTSRSDNNLDYATFGQLGDIIRHNWDIFGGMLSNKKALGRVMSALNNLRGPIAHCGVLADDEVDRLKLAVKDWFRVLAGPK